jgi:glycosyltransferase involved in cell wall biosynthesis
LACAPDDAQIIEDRQRMRVAQHGRAEAALVNGKLAALPFLVPATASLPPDPHGTDVHIVAGFRDPDGEHEHAALALARMLAADSPVTLWATCPDVARRFRQQRVRTIDVARGSFPRSGALILVGVPSLPPIWLTACAASRIVAVHDTDRHALLLDLVLTAHAAHACPIQVVTPSEIFRSRCRIPAASCPLPIDLERFRPADRGPRMRRFTVGRRSRNDHRLFHPQDPALFRRLVASEIDVRILGGTVLMRHFPPSRPVAGLALLAADAHSPEAFMRDIDCVFYRTSPLHAEAGGHAIAEALAAGVPVVCARDVGYAELIAHGVDGFVFDRDDDDAALRHIAVLHADAALLARMGRAARAKAEATFGAALTRRLRRIYAGDALANRSVSTARDPVDCAPA